MATDKNESLLTQIVEKGFDSLKEDIEDIKKDLKEVNDEVKDIKNSLYEPDQGIYARLVKIDTKANQHQWLIDILGKGFWLILGAGITVLAKLIFGF
jgi:hypothetical protein